LPAISAAPEGTAWEEVLIMRILRVSSVADWQGACAAPGPRAVVFDKGGYFELDRESVIDQDDMLVLGETAPEPVIFSKFGLRVQASNVTLRHLTILPGPGLQAQDRDGVRVLPTKAHTALRGFRAINLSVGWSCDEIFSLAHGAVTDALIQDCIFAEALRIAGGQNHPEWTHPKGPHAMGMLIGRRNRNVRVVSNLFAFNFFRNPAVHVAAEACVVGNIIYSPFEEAAHVYVDKGAGPQRASFSGNWLIDGPTVHGNRVTGPVSSPKPMTQGRFEAYDNHRAPLDAPLGAKVRAAIAHAGARPSLADGFSERIRRSVLERTGTWRDGPDLPWPDPGPRQPGWTRAPDTLEALLAYAHRQNMLMGGRTP
jgi:hypothetical protein